MRKFFILILYLGLAGRLFCENSDDNPEEIERILKEGDEIAKLYPLDEDFQTLIGGNFSKWRGNYRLFYYFTRLEPKDFSRIIKWYVTTDDDTFCDWKKTSEENPYLASKSLIKVATEPAKYLLLFFYIITSEPDELSQKEIMKFLNWNFMFHEEAVIRILSWMKRNEGRRVEALKKILQINGKVLKEVDPKGFASAEKEYKERKKEEKKRRAKKK